jgi:hypothetical protein
VAEQQTCGQGLAEHAALPDALARLIGALADNLEVHMHALDLTDPAAAREHDAYAALAARQRRVARELRETAAEMTGHAGLPMGRHDPAALGAEPARAALDGLVAAERAALAVLQERIARHEELQSG